MSDQSSHNNKQGGSAEKKHQYYNAGRVRRSLAYYLSGRGVTAIASMLVPLLLVRSMTVGDYARYTAYSGLLIVLMTLSNLGIERVVPRYLPELRNAGAEDELCLTSRFLTIVRASLLFLVLILLLLGYGYVAKWFNLAVDTKAKWAFVLYAFSFGMSMYFARTLQALMLQKEAAIGVAFEWFLKLAVLSVLLFCSGRISLHAAILLQGGTAAVGAIYMFCKLQLHLGRPRKVAKSEILLNRKQVVRTGLENYFWVLSGMYTGPPVVKLISSSLFSPALTAALGFAYAVTGVVQRYMPSVLLLNIIEPAIMAKFSGNRDFRLLNHYISIVFKFNLFVLLPVAIWFPVNGAPLVELVTKGKYPESVWMISALLIVLILQSHTMMMQLTCNAVEKSNILLQSNIWAMVLLPVAAVAIYIYGLPGLFLSLLAIMIFRNLYCVKMLRRNGYCYRLDFKRIINIIFSAASSVFVAWLIVGNRQDGLIGAAAGLIITIVCFGGIAYLFKGFSREERETLNEFLGRVYFVW